MSNSNNNRYKFIQNSNQLSFNPAPQTFKFYQVCTFKNPWTKTHKIRRFVFNEKGDIVSVDERSFDNEKYMMFLQVRKPNEYKLYNAYDLNAVSYPCSGELCVAQSPILETDADYSGFAKF